MSLCGNGLHSDGESPLDDWGTGPAETDCCGLSRAILALLSVCLPLNIDLSTHGPVKPRSDQKVNLIFKHTHTHYIETD